MLGKVVVVILPYHQALILVIIYLQLTIELDINLL